MLERRVWRTFCLNVEHKVDDFVVPLVLPVHYRARHCTTNAQKQDRTLTEMERTTYVGISGSEHGTLTTTNEALKIKQKGHGIGYKITMPNTVRGQSLSDTHTHWRRKPSHQRKGHR